MLGLIRNKNVVYIRVDLTLPLPTPLFLKPDVPFTEAYYLLLNGKN